MKNYNVDPYTNKDGEVETPKQLWYFIQYENLPPHLRTISNLRQILEKQQELTPLPYKLVCEKTLYNYRYKFDWDKRIFANIKTGNKEQQMVNSDYLFKLLWEDTFNYHQESRKLLSLIDWNGVNIEDTEKIRNLCEMQSKYNMVFKTLTGQPTSFANMFAMIEILYDMTHEEEDKLENKINELLYSE